MALSPSGQIIARLRGQGLNMQTIGQAVGRDRSLIRQIGVGAKPGNNLRDSLAALEARVNAMPTGANKNAPTVRQAAGPVAARRTNAAGAEVRVRKPRTVTGRGGAWSSTTLKRQATKAGAHGARYPLAAAADAGQGVAVTVGVSPRVTVNNSSGGGSRAAGSVTMNLGDAADVLDRLDEYGGDFAALVLDALSDAGHVSTPPGMTAATALTEIELRSF